MTELTQNYLIIVLLIVAIMLEVKLIMNEYDKKHDIGKEIEEYNNDFINQLCQPRRKPKNSDTTPVKNIQDGSLVVKKDRVVVRKRHTHLTSKERMELYKYSVEHSDIEVKDIAAYYGVSVSSVYRIIQNRGM